MHKDVKSRSKSAQPYRTSRRSIMNQHLKVSILLLSAFSFSCLASTTCNSLAGCERKLCEIEYQIEKAKQYNHQYKVDGLTTALKAEKENCTNQGLKDEILDKIEDKEEDIVEYQADLKRAETENRSDKVSKYERKIKEKQREIDALKQELSKIP